MIKMLEVTGYIEAVIFLILLVKGIGLWIKGIVPAMLRLGNGLASREIAIFSDPQNLASLRQLLEDSKIFSKKNIYEVGGLADIGRAENASVYLIHWSPWKDQLDAILAKKKDGTALIVYAPTAEARISDEAMNKLNVQRNVSVANFRGRLLNDIVTAMITTGYEKA